MCIRDSLWSVRCGEAVQTWYVDLYHCGSPCPPHGASLIDADAFALYSSSMELARVGQRVGAAGAMRRAVSLDDGNQGLWTWLGTLELALGNHGAALTAFERADAIAPGDLEIQLRTSVALFEMGRYQEYLDAVDVLTDGMSNYDPRQPELFCRRAGCLLYTSPSPRDQRGSRMPSSA